MLGNFLPDGIDKYVTGLTVGNIDGDTRSLTLTRNGGLANIVTNIDVNDNDNSTSNETLTSVTYTAGTNTLGIVDPGGTYNIDLSDLDDDTDADADPNNEIQTISKSGSTVTLSDGGGSFTDAVDDADASASNELQTLSQSGTNVTLSNGGGTISVADNDNSTSNEIQDLSLSGNTLSLSSDASTVDLSGLCKYRRSKYQRLWLIRNNINHWH